MCKEKKSTAFYVIMWTEKKTWRDRDLVKELNKFISLIRP
jgi:hypothetical protein